jgi:hypothetical protein
VRSIRTLFAKCPILIGIPCALMFDSRCRVFVFFGGNEQGRRKKKGKRPPFARISTCILFPTHF